MAGTLKMAALNHRYHCAGNIALILYIKHCFFFHPIDIRLSSTVAF